MIRPLSSVGSNFRMFDLNAYVSQDIWFEILKELPVKTLGKCRCVCKSWRSLIVSPTFMAAHLKHYTRNNANSVIMYQEYVQSSNTRLEFEQISLFRDLEMLKQGNRLHTSTCPLISLVGSVNGLLCVSDSNYRGLKDHILIWNPLIQKSITLPKSKFRRKISVIGFGYDCHRNDYRVVKFSYSQANDHFVEVYSVQERAWRTICAKYLVDNSIQIVFPASHSFFNGVIHWMAYSTKGGIIALGVCLLLFDVAKERFAKMELPEEIVKSGLGDFGIFEYQGMLSVSWIGNMETPTECRIWVKRDYNVESSWSKILNVCSLYGYDYSGPLHYLGANMELIGFYTRGTGQIVSYDPKTGQIMKLLLFCNTSIKFSAYSESLALLDQTIVDPTVA